MGALGKGRGRQGQSFARCGVARKLAFLFDIKQEFSTKVIDARHDRRVYLVRLFEVGEPPFSNGDVGEEVCERVVRVDRRLLGVQGGDLHDDDIDDDGGEPKRPLPVVPTVPTT